MRIHVRRRLGLSTIVTAMIMLSAVAILGTAGLVLSKQNFTLFKTILDETFASTAAISQNQESLVIENPVYHSSTQQFNFTLTNTGQIPINVTKIEMNSPTLSVTAIPSASIGKTAQTSVISSNSKSITYAIPGSVIFPGNTYTSTIPYNCFTDPVSVTVTTSRGSTIKTQVAPNVGWYDSHWQFRKRITVDYTKVVGNLQSFPVLINTIDTDLQNNAQASGNDILFTSCNGVTKLNHESENYTSLTGSLTAWAQVPKLNSTTNDIIYMYYGNSAATSQQNVAATWDSNYGGVWHFKERIAANFAQVDNVQSTSATSNTVTLTIPGDSNSNTLLLVAVQSSTGTVSTLKFNGVALTQSAAHITNTVDSEIWYLATSLSAGGTITVTMSASANVVVGAYSLSAVDQTTPISSVATKASTSDNGDSISITTVNNNSIVVDSWAFDYSSTSFTANSPQIQKWSIFVSPSLLGGSSTETVSTSSVINMGWTWSTDNQHNYAAVAVGVKSFPHAIFDSTSNQNHLTFNGLVASDQVSGQIDGSLNFDGATKYLNRTSSLIGLPSNANSPQTGSIWFWIPTSNRGSFAQDIYSFQTSGGGSAVKVGYKSSTTTDVWNWGGSNLVSNTVPSAGTWHYIVYTYDGNAGSQGKTHRLYIDGVQVSTSTVSPDAGSLGALYVGTNSLLNEYYNGKLDEFRYSTTARSASWISTEYNNQASPSTFYTIGPPEQVTDVRSSQ